MPPKAMDEDYSATVDKRVPEMRDLALQRGKLGEAIEGLLALEKQTRQAGDSSSTKKLAIAIPRICFEAKDFPALNESLILLAKRRGQFKEAVREMVQEAMKFVDQVDKTTKINLIETMRTITEGKIYVELERARLTRMLAEIKEHEGDVATAADILQSVQVETFGTMEKREKIEFILEQMRLCLDIKDSVRAQILSRKIVKKALEDDKIQDLKIRFNELMIRYHSFQEDYLAICHCYHEIYMTKIIQEDSSKWQHYLQKVVLFLCLSTYNNEQSDFMNRVYLYKQLRDLPRYRDLLKFFLTVELLRWPKLKQLYEEELKTHDVFASKKQEEEGGNPYWINLHKRVVEHNLRVVSSYYRQISARRLSELLDLSPERTEFFLSEQVVAKAIYAKLDRPAGIIHFIRRQDPNELLNDWAHDVSSVLSLVETTRHLIHRERMVHAV